MGKDMAYNADVTGLALMPPHSFIVINFIKAKVGVGSYASRFS